MYPEPGTDATSLLVQTTAKQQPNHLTVMSNLHHDTGVQILSISASVSRTWTIVIHLTQLNQPFPVPMKCDPERSVSTHPAWEKHKGGRTAWLVESPSDAPDQMLSCWILLSLSLQRAQQANHRDVTWRRDKHSGSKTRQVACGPFAPVPVLLIMHPPLAA